MRNRRRHRHNRYYEESSRSSVTGGLTICLLVMMVLWTCSIVKIADVQRENRRLTQEKDELESRVEDLELATINEDDVPAEETDVMEPSIGLDSVSFTNALRLKKENDQEEQEREKIIQDYSYVLYDTSGKRNDMTEDLVMYGYELCEKMKLNPDLLFGIIKVESEGHADAVNKVTKATGLGQIVESTGKYICSDIIGGIEYDHNVTPYDPKMNMLLSATYLEYLYKLYDGSTMDVIREYSGTTVYDDTFSYYMRVCNACGYCID